MVPVEFVASFSGCETDCESAVLSSVCDSNCESYVDIHYSNDCSHRLIIVTVVMTTVKWV